MYVQDSSTLPGLFSNLNRVFPVGEHTSNMNNLLLYATCVNGQLQKMSGPDSLDIVQSSCVKIFFERATFQA